MFNGPKGTHPGIKGRPWRRRKKHPDPWPHREYRYVKEHSFKLSFSVYEDANMDLDINLKIAALGVSPSVVSVVTYSGEKRIFCGSGTIIQCDEANGTYHGTILSSATLVRGRTLENCRADNIKVDVHLFNGKSYKGEILTCDIHYNILLMKILSDVPLTTASIKRLDDCVKIGPSEVLPGNESFQLHPHSALFKILPSETVIAVGRYFQPYKLMAAAGFFSVECCKFDCKELFRVNCRISKCGIGGPVVNHYGEVIGMSFYADYYTPFLPINVVLKWLAHYKKYLGLCRPQLGMQLANLYTADVKILEKIIQKFPDISAGVIVEKIEEGSPVDTAGLRCKDIIVQCSGNIVQSLLQLFEICWEKAGEVVELVVMRADEGARLSLSVVVAENRTEKLNRWPVPGMCRRQKWRCY